MSGAQVTEQLVSVIIPVFNGESTIGRTLDSVLAQTHGHLEVLVIDDGSHDRTAELVEAYDDSRIALHRFANRGAHISRNRGLEMASGRFLSFLDADDWWRADKLEKQLGALSRRPEASVAYSFTQYVDEQGVPLHRGYQGRIEGDVLTELFVRFFLQNGSNALIRREVVERIGGFDERLDVCDDYDFYLRAAEHFRFALVPEHQIFYRVRSGSLSTQVVRMRRASHLVIRRAVARQPQLLGPLKPEAMAVTDAYIFTKALESERAWRNIPLSLSCLFTLLRAGRPGWKMFYDRRGQTLYWLRRVAAWLLPEAVLAGLRRSTTWRKQRRGA